MKHKIICGHVADVLKTFPDESIDTVVTSPPYWGLRSYLPDDHPDKQKEIGLEPTLDLYINHLIEVMSELKRILKRTGVIFWNHGDCYGGSLQGWGAKQPSKTGFQKPAGIDERYIKGKPPNANITPKCMALQNYRFILRCVDELGLILRNVIIWHKPNHMPSSVKDRFTSSYEPVFMLVKNRNYWFDLDAVRLPHKESSRKRVLRAVSNKHKYLNHPEYSGGGGINKPRPNRRKLSIKFSELFDKPDREYHREQNMAISQYQYAEGDYLVVNLHPLGGNPGDVWSIPTQGFSGAHFATFPEKLVEPLIKCSCPQWICKKCGKARERIIKTKLKNRNENIVPSTVSSVKVSRAGDSIHYNIGWTDCGCNAGWEAGIVLDPFAGSGTVGIVAEKLRRNSILIDLNKEYCEMAYRRIKKVAAQTKLGEESSIIERVGF